MRKVIWHFPLVGLPSRLQSRHLLILLLGIPALTAQVKLIPLGPESGEVRAVRSDGAGSTYLAGLVYSPDAEPGNRTDAFVVKIAADGSQLYRTLLSGSGDDFANAIALGRDGVVYVSGTTSSNDFPTAADTVQPILGSTIGRQAFLARLSEAGELESATYFGGGAQTSGSALALDSEGGVYLTGTVSGDGFPATSGYAEIGNGFFLAKLDPALTVVVFATLAYGGTELTLDGEGNIYTAGAASAAIGQDVPLQTTVDAFQSSARAMVCRGGGIVFFPCPYQFVQKLDPSATKLLFGTFLTGSFGATPAGIAVDAGGEVVVAGTTNSPDYPVTEQAFQAFYPASATEPPVLPGSDSVYPSPAAGYITKLDSKGTGPIWSTFFGGSTQEAISDIAFAQDGSIVLTGQANSHDLPGILASAPDGCRPGVNQGIGFVARLSSEGTVAGPTQLIYGAPSCYYASCSANMQRTSSDAFAVASRVDGKVVVAGPKGLFAEVELGRTERLACITDPADNVQLTEVAPGQLLSLFGSSIGPSDGSVPPGGTATSFVGISVTLDGIAAPILYASRDQINVQVPYEIAGRDSVEMQVVSVGGGWTARRTLAVVPRQPSVFLSAEAILAEVPGRFYCENSFVAVPHALTLNADGTVNSCHNGAAVGSIVAVFMNGVGSTQPTQATGSVLDGPPIALAPLATGQGIVSTTNLPGSISGVAKVQVQPTDGGFLEVFPEIDGIASRQPVAIWVVPQ